MGHARCTFTCLISSTTSQRPGNLYSVVSTYQQHLRQEERHRQDRAIMISQEVDLVARDFSGTAWRYRIEDNLSTIDEAFTDCALPTLRGPTPLWNHGSIPDNWADVCGFLKPQGSQRFWKVRMHGAFSIPRKTPGLRPTDQSCHHETWLHLDFVDRSNTWSKKGDYDRHISLKERPAACSYGHQKRRISEVMSDHSLPS